MQILFIFHIPICVELSFKAFYFSKSPPKAQGQNHVETKFENLNFTTKA